ncbi:hypothetical protein SAPIO_CDS9158 [Scedosporium apiospermum]|uniref:Cytochrome P450 n=1 Tax=Pseudallescheria apiosperma TaxID=563466 RepID=A0A084FYG4_PSEDA|nr:uncharacterized protein SAPIO_CDS9158 [Scedosporium apiospermum]KEZ40126.1 hypothetical protein SAPIO_CDS9158 [Scedosporium apiospermum]
MASMRPTMNEGSLALLNKMRIVLNPEVLNRMGIVFNREVLGHFGLIHGLTTLVSFTVLAQIARLALSKLRDYPGPFWAKMSSLWLARQCRYTRRSAAVMEQHEKYGDFVRIAPNHISINSAEAVAQIYGHKTGFTKSDFYDAFLQVRPVIFNARDVAQHTRKRKYMNPAFSARALSDFEPQMNIELLAWKRQLRQIHDEEQGCLDMVVWTNYLAFDVIGSFAFGKSFGFIEKGYDQYNLIHTIDMRGEVLNALGTLSAWMRPFVRYNFFDSFWSSGLRATANLEKIGREAYVRRKESTEERRDAMSYLFAAADPKNKEPIQEAEIIAESISFIVGGSDTTSSTMTNFIDFVSRDRAIQVRIQQELDESWPGEQDDDWVPEEHLVVKLPFLVAVLREVMRFRPTSATGLERITPKGGKVIAGKFIPENDESEHFAILRIRNI